MLHARRLPPVVRQFSRRSRGRSRGPSRSRTAGKSWHRESCDGPDHPAAG
ncbi:hypothetical protein SLNWT_4747 [Streptomyces albus]|uniref:Uncharacterized protein n=1 Tax=Streptomyces albus (strain ATCC 21838 / DSM 41398 / FERM P-419 / JCM 4703 / NBRC 107858) TaxID=1081613 RepID=A0A0B5EQR3_STRA4|nr:hypothetical protein SLNWT_4747 [Streptomyces albus]